jgi:hypothetical protein
MIPFSFVFIIRKAFSGSANPERRVLDRPRWRSSCPGRLGSKDPRLLRAGSLDRPGGWSSRRGSKKDLRGGRRSEAALDAAQAARAVPCRPEAGTRRDGHGPISMLLSRVSPGKLSPGPPRRMLRAKARILFRAAGGGTSDCLGRRFLSSREQIYKRICKRRARSQGLDWGGSGLWGPGISFPLSGILRVSGLGRAGSPSPCGGGSPPGQRRCCAGRR